MQERTTPRRSTGRCVESRVDRGQTLQDFVLGISIFVIAFVVVLSMFPGLLSPFDSEITDAERATADRISETIVSNASQPAHPNYLETSTTNEIFGLSRADLETRYNLSTTTRVNLTLESLDGSSRIKTTGDVVTRNQTATSVRIIQTDACSTACRLVVRAW